jgi:hypothetical protein
MASTEQATFEYLIFEIFSNIFVSKLSPSLPHVGLDGCDSVPSSSPAMIARWHTCSRPAGTGGQGVPVGDMAGKEQATFEFLIFEKNLQNLFQNFLHRRRIQWPGEAAYGRVPDRRREGS